MKKGCLVVVFLIVMVCGAGCVTKYENPGITVTSPDIMDITPTNVGNFDLYAIEFQVENPTNMTFKNVEVQINVIPVIAYCHPLAKTIEIPSFSPAEKRKEIVSLTEFSDLQCEYSYTYSVVAER
jgi:hypothetical protein